MVLSGLILSPNNISHIPDDAFFGLTFYGANLLLGHNPLHSISKNAFRGIIGSISRVQLASCDLTEFPGEALSKLPHLSFLWLQNNLITEIPNRAFQPFPRLFTVSLGGNAITNINREGLFYGVEHVLENVDLSSMNISSFPSKALKNLKRVQRINLSYNNITTLPGNTFEGFQTEMRLQILLEGNNMISISPNLFRKSPISLCRLNLTDNQLTTLDFINVCLNVFECESTKDVPILPSILVTQNPLKCDCDTIKHLRPDHLTIVGKCDQPTMYQGLDLYRPQSQMDFYGNASEECPDFEANICSSGLKIFVTFLTMLTCLLIFSCIYINF